MYDQPKLDGILKSKRFELEDFNEISPAIYKAASKCRFQSSGVSLCQKLIDASQSFYASTGAYGDVVIATQQYIDKFKEEVGDSFEPSDQKAGKLNIVGYKSKFIFLTSDHWKYDECVLTYVGRRLNQTHLSGFINPVEHNFYMIL